MTIKEFLRNESGRLLLLLLTKRLTWRLVQKLQGHVTYKKRKTTCSVDREKQAVEEQRSEHSVRHCEQVRL